MQFQSLDNKLGEIKYRQRISQQHTGQKTHFENEPNQTEIKKILSKRLAQYKKTFEKLKKRNLLVSPFLEIGAEYSLASSLLESKFNLGGISSDISVYSLAKTKHFAKLFNLTKTPKLVCADAYNLPFKSNSFPFIFLFETLHHFPDPKPILEEIYRVLAPGGYFLIGADPIAQSLQLKLWRRPTKLRRWEKLLKYLLILPFISHIGATEKKFNIIESGFNLKTWLKSLEIFSDVEAQITLYPFGPMFRVKRESGKWPNLNPAIKLYLFCFGADMQALCIKSESPKNSAINRSGKKILICPNCLSKGKKEIFLTNLHCNKCQTSYFQKQGIPILTENQIAKSLIS